MSVRSSAILICSDRATSGDRPDQTAPLLQKRLEGLGFVISGMAIVPDEIDSIVARLRQWSEEQVALVLISGGTGLSDRDVTPEATLRVIDRLVPGMAEAMRAASLEFTPKAMLSRAVVGIANRTLIVNLPGNPDGALQNLAAIEPALDHALAIIAGERPDR